MKRFFRVPMLRQNKQAYYLLHAKYLFLLIIYSFVKVQTMCFDVLRGDYHIVFIAGLVHRDGFGGRERTVAFSAPLEDIRTGCSGRALARPVTIVGLIRLTPLFLVICYQLLKQRFEHDNKH